MDSAHLTSFSAVARKRGVTASSVARQVSALEKELGVALFIRTTRALTLTTAGQTLLERSEKILKDLEDAKLEATSHQTEVRGVLRILCWPTFGRKHIVPHLRSLLEQYPKLTIDLDLSERLHDPVLDRTDLAFRIGELVDSTLVATRLGQQRSVFVASPDYLARFGNPRTLSECSKHNLIDKRHPAALVGWRSLLGRNQKNVFEADDLSIQLEACVEGIGIAHLPDWVAYEEIVSGKLSVLSLEPSNPSKTTPIFILRNPGPISAASGAFCAHIRKCIGEPPIWTL